MQFNATNTTDTVSFSYVLAVAVPDTFVWLISLTLRVTLVILCIVWRKEQPIKSRNPIPIIFALSFMIVFDSNKFLSMWVYANAWPQWTLTIRFFFTIPLITTMSLIMCYQYIRYYTLRYLDNAKVSGSVVQVKLLRAIASRKVILLEVLGVISLFLLSVLLTGLCFGLGPASAVTSNLKIGTLSTTSLLIILCVNGVIVLGLAFICVTIALHDVIHNMPKQGVTYYFGEGDPYKYRVDGLVTFIMAIIYIGSLIIMAYPNDDPTESNKGAQAFWVIIRVTNYAIELCVFLGSGFTCVLAVARMKLKPKEIVIENETELQRLLRLNGRGKKLFEEYIKSEFSSENILCHTKLQGYQKLSGSELASLAKDVYNTYVKTGTLAEVNLPEHVQRQFKEISCSENASQEQLTTIINKLDQEILSNLGDSFMRFQSTQSYKKYLEATMA
jgi:hypothetical protein